MNQTDIHPKTFNKKLFLWLIVIILAYALPRIFEDELFPGSSEQSASDSSATNMRRHEIEDAARTSLSPQEQAVARAIKNDIVDNFHYLAAVALQYRLRPVSLGGGEGSYVGFKLPKKLTASENAVYDAEIISPDAIRFVAVSAKNRHDMVVVEFDRSGQLGNWTFTGAFRHIE
jgi:hypothetical protein